jgi:hypothetical protein
MKKMELKHIGGPKTEEHLSRSWKSVIHFRMAASIVMDVGN